MYLSTRFKEQVFLPFEDLSAGCYTFLVTMPSSSSSSEDLDVSKAESVEHAVADKFNDLPASTPSEAAEKPPHPIKSRLFNREKSVHSVLGGGKGYSFSINPSINTNVSWFSTMKVV